MSDSPKFPFSPQYSLDNTRDMSIAHLCGIVVSFARLNFQPSSGEEFFSMVHEQLQGQVQQLDPHVLTDVVWSLCVLQQAQPPYLRQVLAPEFHTRLRGEGTAVAFVRWEFPQFSSRGRELLGRGALARRHLRRAGFLLVEVPHYEFLELKLERQRVSYLRDKVAKAVASDMATDTAPDTAA
ncbi:FAST kinase domain-containing protein 4 [Empidonax traillii]|uniref:FAST kinase domain-containing protein 4 n=1 Tax=Empidonax traillii TaxID=164674 RepID=UPI000FFD62BF|nr:FAST kinase domain-containing protein 4 [Empidonax traillii]